MIKKKYGLVFRYCSICDDDYESGTYMEHKKTSKHKQLVKDRASMDAWYKANGK